MAVQKGCITLMVSVVYKKRTLPLMWVTRKGGKGTFPEACRNYKNSA